VQAFLKCGVLAHGFSRFRCSDCRFERLVPLSCKGRGFCPSCGGKRMTDVAAHLTDHVGPLVPVRQFVLSFPHALRYRLAYDHDRCTAVLRIFMRTVLAFYRRRARERGMPGGRSGSVTFVQRFGSAANLNLHAHAIVLDGVFAQTPNGELHFHRADPPSDADIAALLATIRKRILRHLDRHGLLQDDRADPFSDDGPLLATCYATSITHRRTLGKHPGARLHRLGDPDAARAEHRAPLQAHIAPHRSTLSEREIETSRSCGLVSAVGGDHERQPRVHAMRDYEQDMAHEVCHTAQPVSGSTAAGSCLGTAGE
jgi:Transposase zinc-binding domain/Putative transposase